MQAIDNNFRNAHRPVRSACIAASRRHDLERLRRLSIEARIEAALGMGARFSWLKPTAVER